MPPAATTPLAGDRTHAPAPPAETHRDRWWLAGIVFVGLALRVAWALYAARPPVGLKDPTFYMIFAGRLADGLGYSVPNGEPTAYYPVGYPGALAALFWLADRTPLPDDRMAIVVFLNLVAAVVSFVLVFAIGRRLFDRRVGLAAAGLLAVMPNLIFHSGLALTETVFNTLALAAVLVIVSTTWRSPPVRALAAFGLLVGLAALVRPPSLLFVPVLALAGWWAAGWGWRELGRAVAVPTAVAAAVILPWTVRNLVEMEAPILISSNVGDNLCIGNNPEATGAFSLPRSCLDGYDDLARPAYEVRRDADGRAKAIRFILEEPAEQLRLIPLRAYWTFSADTDGLRAAESYGEDRFIGQPLRRVLELAANTTFFATLALGLAAVVLLRSGGRDPGRTFVVLVAASLAVTPLVFFGDLRFHVPVVPFLVIGAAALVVAGLDRRRGRALT